jgi:hypothetical protein
MTKLFKFFLETTNRTDYGQTIRVIIGWSFINIANHGISFKSPKKIINLDIRRFSCFYIFNKEF